MTPSAGGEWVFHDIDGQHMPAAPTMALTHAWEDVALPDDAGIRDVTPGPVWDGAPFNLVWAMDVLYERVAASRTPRQQLRS